MTTTTLKQPGFVYVMQCQSIYKIGSSRNPEKRIKEFGADSIVYKNRLIYIGNHVVITRCYAVDNMLAAERLLQSIFHAKRIQEPGKRNRREWFELDLSDLAQIDILIAPFMTIL